MASRAVLVDSTGTTYYTWDGIRVLRTEDDVGALRQRQVHGYGATPSVGDIALMEAGGSEYVPVSDQVGTVWKALDSSASTANAYSYDAFGVSRSVSETVANPYRFAGKPLDPDPSLYHFIARQYMAMTGRFLSVDRFGLISHTGAAGLAAGPQWAQMLVMAWMPEPDAAPPP